MSTEHAPRRARFRPWPLVALAAWLLPGMGHALIGEGRRGAVVGATLIGLFALGLLVGGIDCVDRTNDTLWFAGQSMIGPLAYAVDTTHRELERRRERSIGRFAEEHGVTHEAALERMIRAGERLPYTTSVGRVNEYGTLYCAIAGVMNLLAILDAIGRATAHAPASARPVKEQG